MTELRSILQFRTFWISFVAMLLVVVASHLGFRPPTVNMQRFVSPQPVNTNINETILPKLEQIENDFELKKPTNIIQEASAADLPNDASGYGVIDFESGEVLAEKNLNKRLPIASLTKVMTAVVALDLASKDEAFNVSANASEQIPTKIGVVEGQKMTLEELLNALLLTSANDSAEVIKEGIDAKYGEELFIEAMNLKAKHLGLNNSNFTNPQGFDWGENYSSVEDLLVLTHYALKNYPLIAQISAKDYMFLAENQNHKQFDLYNWNGLLGVYPGTSGVKIGNTDDAGFTTIVLSKRENDAVLTVLLGAPGVLERDLWASQLLDHGFQKLANLEPVNITEAQLKEKYSTWQYWN